MASSSSSSSSCKRRRVVLTLEQKLAILDRLKKGESQEKLASEYGAGRSMISDIKKSEEKLKSYASTMESLSRLARRQGRWCAWQMTKNLMKLSICAVVCSFVQKREVARHARKRPYTLRKSHAASAPRTVARRMWFWNSISSKPRLALALLSAPWSKAAVLTGRESVIW